MLAMQNALNFIIDLQGIDVQIKDLSDGTEYTVKAAQSNYFRKPEVDEQIVATGRQYVISTKNLQFTPQRGDRFLISATDYYSIAQVVEMRALGNVVGYRLMLE